MSPGHGAPRVLHLAPHADDELIGAPATLMALRDAGWEVVNLTCSLGRPEQCGRRRAEVTEACRRAGFGSEVVEPPLPDPLDESSVQAAERHLTASVADAVRRLRPRLVVGPSPHDRHRGHEVAGRSALAACAVLSGDGPERLWLWGLWADLPFPSLAVAFGEERLEEILGALSAYGGELERNDYRRLVRGRAEMNASVGPERIFGFGTEAPGERYVELLTELGRHQNSWRLGRPRWLDPRSPVGELGPVELDGWLGSASITDTFGPPG